MNNEKTEFINSIRELLSIIHADYGIGTFLKPEAKRARAILKKHATHECSECGGIGHTIGFEGSRRVSYQCESCPQENTP